MDAAAKEGTAFLQRALDDRLAVEEENVEHEDYDVNLHILCVIGSYHDHFTRTRAEYLERQDLVLLTVPCHALAVQDACRHTFIHHSYQKASSPGQGTCSLVIPRHELTIHIDGLLVMR